MVATQAHEHEDTAHSRSRPGIDGRSRNHRVLLVDHDEDEAALFQDIVRDTTLPITLEVAHDGAECLEMLPQLHPRPELILLELEIPQMDGLETLRRLKEDERFRHIPVLIFTNSDDPYHVHDCYDQHAAAYMTKPGDPDQYRALLQAMHQFWFGCAALCED